MGESRARYAQGRIDHVLEVRRIVFFDHLDTGAAILGDLIDISAFEQAKTNIAVAQAICRARFAIAVEFQIVVGEDVVEHLLEFARKEPVGGFGFL